MIILYFTRFALPYDREAKVLPFGNKNKRGFILYFARLIVPLSGSSKVGGISEIKINGGLFCISLDLHYL